MIMPIFVKIFKGTLHLGAVVVLIFAFSPIADWYFSAKPLWGVDFYYTASLVTYLRDHFAFPHVMWFYPWFGGWPLAFYSPVLHYYLILPFLNFFEVIASIKIWMLVSTAFFVLGVYVLCVRLSRNVGLGLLMALTSVFSVGVYGALTWGGSMPSYATQAFYPWIIFFIVFYLESAKARYLYVASLLTGLSILGHPIIAIGYIFPTSLMLFLLYSGIHFHFFSKKKLLSFLTFLFISVVIASPLLYQSFGGALSSLFLRDVNSTTSTVTIPGAISQDVVAFIRSQPHRIYTDNHQLLFIFLGLFAGFFLVRLLIVSGRILAVKHILPYLIIGIYYVAYIWVFAYGISIYHGGWYRLFWSVPVWVGMLVAILFRTSIGDLLSKIRHHPIRISSVVLVTLIIFLPGLFLWNFYNQGFFDRLRARSEYSSAYPGVLNLRKLDKKELLPDFMLDDWQYRYYDGDATINIWWTSQFTRPLVRGYLDPPITLENRSFLFLTDTALSQDEGKPRLTLNFGFPENLALNNALFFIDWNAIKFLGTSPTDAGFITPDESVLSFANIKNKKEIDFFEVYKKRGKETLRFFEFQDYLTSPIAQVVSVPVVGIVSGDNGFETILRTFAHMNLNSQDAIPVRLGKSLDGLSLKELLNFDLLILYEYDYSDRGRVDRTLLEYIKSGGNIFIDTGSEVKDSSTLESIEILPVTSTARNSFGRKWGFDPRDDPIVSVIDFSLFSPPLFDEDPWKVSYSEDLRQGGKALMLNHKKLVLASQEIGEGKIIWSGLNLPYHIVRYNNSEEVKFFQNIISSLINKVGERSSSGISRPKSEKLVIVNPKGKGVLFKEQNYPGWRAIGKSKGQSQSLKIYKAGPANPGYMYVPLPKEPLEKIEISFGLDISRVPPILAFLGAILWSIDSIVGTKILPLIMRKVYLIIKHQAKRWWDKEDE